MAQGLVVLSSVECNGNIPQQEDTIGYYIEERLARTENSHVFLATSHEDQSQVALKIATRRAAAALVEEVGVHLDLSDSHRGVLPICGYGSLQGRPYLATPFQERGSLQDRIGSDLPITITASEAVSEAIEKIEKGLPPDTYSRIDLATANEVITSTPKRELVSELQSVDCPTEAIDVVSEVIARQGHEIDSQSLLGMAVTQKMLEDAKEALPDTDMSIEEFRKRLDIIRDVAGVLTCMHARGMVHRDVKPSNIMISQLERGLLGDFGATMYVGEETDGIIRSTKGYMAAEVCDGNVGTAGDVFAIAAVAYQALCGGLPWKSAGSLAEDKAVMEKFAPKVPTAHNPLLRKELSDVIMKGLSVSPEDRPSASDMSRLLVA